MTGIARKNADGTFTPISQDEMEEAVHRGEEREFFLSDDLTEDEALALVRESTRRLNARRPLDES